MKSNYIFCAVVTAWDRFMNSLALRFRSSLLVGPLILKSYGTILIAFLSNIAMLIMRIYALYERSRKVLALYIVVAVAVVIGGCVSLENQRFPSFHF